MRVEAAQMRAPEGLGGSRRFNDSWLSISLVDCLCVLLVHFNLRMSPLSFIASNPQLSSTVNDSVCCLLI